MKGASTENRIDGHRCYRDLTDNITCAWLKSVVKLQRQILILTAAAPSHEGCERLVRHLVERIGVFGCCHGVVFTPSEEVNSQVSTESFGSTSGNVNEARPSSSTETTLVPEIQEIELFFQNLFEFFKSSDRNSGIENVNDCKGLATFDKICDRFHGLPSGRDVECRRSTSFFNSPICLDSIPEQLAFSFGPFRHTICVGCTKMMLIYLYRSNSTHIQCPVCRESFPMRQFVQQFCEYYSIFLSLDG